MLTKEIYAISVETNLSKDFRFRDQINAAAGSVMDNIAEGFERGGKLELINFLTISKGSCAEVRLQLYRCFDRNFIDENKLNELLKLEEETCVMLARWISYLNQTDSKGSKLKDRI